MPENQEHKLQSDRLPVVNINDLNRQNSLYSKLGPAFWFAVFVT